MNYTKDLTEQETTEQGLERLKKAVQIRDSMGGALYFNIMNEDACQLAGQLEERGVDRNVLSDILGANNFR